LRRRLRGSLGQDAPRLDAEEPRKLVLSELVGAREFHGGFVPRIGRINLEVGGEAGRKQRLIICHLR